MFIKLNFTVSRNFGQLTAVLNEIINNTAITSISALQSEFTRLTYDSGWLVGLDAANSEIWRTADSSNVVSRFSKSSTAEGSHNLVIESNSYDSPDQKYYYRFVGTTSTAATVGTGISIPMSTAGFSLVNGVISTGGTPQTLVNPSANVDPLTGTAFSDVRTLWCYITNTCFVWSVTINTTFNTGWQPNNASYSTLAAHAGPFINCQYTRFDNHNNVGNGIIPVMYPNYAKVGGLSSTDLTTIQGVGFTTNTTSLPFRCINFVDADIQTGGFPIVMHPNVANTSGGVSHNNNTARADGRTTGSASTWNAASYGGPYNPNASVRRPTPDAIGSGFGLISIGWEDLFRGNHGGNISDRGKIYIFNAEYAPGDEFVLDGTTWMIWPLYNGFGNRLGLAVPKE
jgi:hypothetical protein